MASFSLLPWKENALGLRRRFTLQHSGAGPVLPALPLKATGGRRKKLLPPLPPSFQEDFGHHLPMTALRVLLPYYSVSGSPVGKFQMSFSKNANSSHFMKSIPASFAPHAVFNTPSEMLPDIHKESGQCRLILCPAYGFSSLRKDVWLC